MPFVIRFMDYYHHTSSSLSPSMNLAIAKELGLQASNHVRYHQSMHSNTPCVPNCSNGVLEDVHPSTGLGSQISS